MYLAACKSISTRKYDRKNPAWVYPVESAPEVIGKFWQMPDVEVDSTVWNTSCQLTYLADHKFDLPSNSHVDLTKTKCLGHQAQWLAWASNFKACANLSEQGTGKSKMALDWLDLKGCSLTLMVCRNSNCYKWADEIRKHSDYRPFILKGTRSERTQALRTASRYSERQDSGTICIINFEYVHSFLGPLAAIEWDAIVLDESTAIKSTRTKRYKACVHISSKIKYKLILTGTPLVNSPLDAYGQFRFLNPNIFGANEYGFKKRYMVFGGFGGYEVLGYKNTAELQNKIERFSFRALKRDCLDLPPKVFQKLDVAQTDDFRKGYKDLVEATILELGGQIIDNTLAISRINRCLQYCDGFLYNPDGSASNHASPKDAELLDFLADHFQSSNKVIIWAYFRHSIRRLHALISKEFPKADVRYGMGRTPVIERSDMVNWFNGSYSENDRQRCIILQSSAFMHGIDLRCDTAIYYSRSWSNEEWLQSQDRIHGINRGGDRSTYILLGIKNTVEESVHHALRRKEGISKFLLKDVTVLEGFLKGLFITEE